MKNDNNIIEYNKQLILDFCKAYNLEYLNDFLIPYKEATIILKEIDFRLENCFTHEEFIKILKNSQFLFAMLNEYEKNKGNLKISKKIGVIENYYKKYKDKEKIPPHYKCFFNTLTTTMLPKKENVYTILKHHFHMLINESFKNKQDAKELSNALMNDLFNIRKFKSNLQYKEILIQNNSIRSLSYCRYYRKLEDKEKYNFEKLMILNKT